jgi:hypothetical protein
LSRAIVAWATSSGICRDLPEKGLWWLGHLLKISTNPRHCSLSAHHTNSGTPLGTPDNLCFEPQTITAFRADSVNGIVASSAIFDTSNDLQRLRQSASEGSRPGPACAGGSDRPIHSANGGEGPVRRGARVHRGQHPRLAQPCSKTATRGALDKSRLSAEATLSRRSDLRIACLKADIRGRD